MPCSEQFCFRPEPAPRPLIAGTLTARIESDEKNAPYGYLDETGRYRVNGVKTEFYPSGWKEVEGVHGYNKPEGIDPPYATYTRNLHDDELRSKVKERAMINAARVARQTTTGSEQ